jgi:DNA/RNA-binding domain of Phe-tRNA-synthetase-like protein
MKFTIAPDVYQKYGNVHFAVLKAAGLTLTEDLTARIEQHICAIELEWSERLKQPPGVLCQACVAEWRSLYSKMGASPSKSSSVESLYSYLKEYGRLPRVLPYVNLYNAVSCSYGLPMAGYDARFIEGGQLVLRHAAKGEAFEPLGLKQVEKTRNGEVVYADGSRVVCRYWNNKDCNQTKIRVDTDEVVFILDGAPSVSPGSLGEASGFLADFLRTSPGVKITLGIVGDEAPVLELA